MGPFADIDYNSRISVIIEVGTALAVPTASLPAATASANGRNCLKWINNIRLVEALPILPDLDYTGFTPAINELAALVP
jgi:hypothetical protein